MPERKYSLSEIDRMRKAISDIHLYEECEKWVVVLRFGLGSGSAPPQPQPARSDGSAIEDLALLDREELLRTYMMAGIDPGELIIRGGAARAKWKTILESYWPDKAKAV